MGTDVFVYHGFAELWLGNRWVRATPTFDIELCRRSGVPSLDFDGTRDALFQAFDGDGRHHIEYLRSHEPRTDLPLEEILEALRAQ